MRNGVGISVAGGSVVEWSAVQGNKSSGIVGSHATIRGNAAFLNGGAGIQANDGSVVRDNSSSRNASDGIAVRHGSLVTDNATYDNGGSGIEAIGRSERTRVGQVMPPMRVKDFNFASLSDAV